MKTFTSLCLTTCIFFSVALRAQQIDSIVVSPPSNISISDTIKIYVHNSFLNSSCDGTAIFNQAGFNIDASALHCQGILAALCNDVDTVILNPPHLAGIYRFIFTLNSGFGMPTCTPGFVPDDRDTTFFEVLVAPIDLPPIVSPLANDSVCENESLGPIAVTISDEDMGTISAWAYSSNQTLIPNSAIQLNGTGANRTLNLTPAANETGNAVITVVAEDHAAQKDSSFFNVEVWDCTAAGILETISLTAQVYPNPSTGKVFIQLDQAYNTLDVTVKDVLGRSVYAAQFNGTNLVELPLETLKGLYYIELFSGRKKSVYKVVMN